MPRHESPPPAAGPMVTPPVEIYSPTARGFHWLVVVLLLVQVPIGFYMAYRGNDLNIWDGLTNGLYSSHKLIGVLILLVVLARLAYRVVHGAPAPEPTLEGWHRLASGINHLGLYVLLLIVPVLGWIGVSLYPALDIFGLFSLPGLVAADQKASETVFEWHGMAALALLAFAAIHIGAALYHYVIRGDNVLGRMIPGLLRK